MIIIDARNQFEKEPKSFGNKRNRMTDAHRQWIRTRYREAWKQGTADPDVKIFTNNGTTKDFAYHKIQVVFWQTDENDQPAIITEPYLASFTSANIAKEQEFYASEITFKASLTDPNSGRTVVETFTLGPDDSFSKLYEELVRKAFADEIAEKAEKLKGTSEEKKLLKRFLNDLHVEAEWTHRHYVEDDEYVPFGDDIDEFMKREIAKPIIRWKDRPQLGYEILPNKYFYRYQPPTPSKGLLDEFWKLEKDAEKLLEQLTK